MEFLTLISKSLFRGKPIIFFPLFRCWSRIRCTSMHQSISRRSKTWHLLLTLNYMWLNHVGRNLDLNHSLRLGMNYTRSCCSTTATAVWTTNIMVLGNADKKNEIEDHGKRVEEHLDNRVHFRPTTVIV